MCASTRCPQLNRTSTASSVTVQRMTLLATNADIKMLAQNSIDYSWGVVVCLRSTFVLSWINTRLSELGG